MSARMKLLSNKETNKKLLVSLLFLWLGLLIGISFMEAPLKFKAPGITLELGLGIGRLVFATLNKMELALAVIIFFPAITLFRNYKVAILSLSVALLILLVQTFYLLPLLDIRAEAILQHKQVLPSSLHISYIGMEVAKLLLLANCGILIQRSETSHVKRIL